jgi:hypothetical protein
MLDNGKALDPVSYHMYPINDWINLDVETSDMSKVIRSEKFCFVIPEIIVLDNEHYVSKKKWSRKKVLLRDNYQCYYCKVTLTSRNKTIDHIFPQSKGGKDTFDNTVACCLPCNSKKGDKLLEELGWSVPLPKVPQHNILYSFPVSSIPESWKPFMNAEKI